MYERFLELLKEKNVKTSDVSKATGIGPGVFSDWKSGRYKPKHDKMMLIAAYFEVAVEYLEGTSDIKIPQSPQWQDYDNYLEELRLEEQWRFEEFMAQMKRCYDQLNFDGQEHLIQTAIDMLQIDRFRKDTKSSAKKVM